MIVSCVTVTITSVQGTEVPPGLQEAVDKYKAAEAAYMAALEQQKLPSAAQQQALGMIAAAFDRACQALVREHRALLDAAAENNRVQLNRCIDVALLTSLLGPAVLLPSEGPAVTSVLCPHFTCIGTGSASWVLRLISASCYATLMCPLHNNARCFLISQPGCLLCLIMQDHAHPTRPAGNACAAVSP